MLLYESYYMKKWGGIMGEKAKYGYKHDDKVISVSVDAIEKSDYDLAYALYRESVLTLEQNYS